MNFQLAVAAQRWYVRISLDIFFPLSNGNFWEANPDMQILFKIYQQVALRRVLFIVFIAPYAHRSIVLLSNSILFKSFYMESSRFSFSLLFYRDHTHTHTRHWTKNLQITVQLYDLFLLNKRNMKELRIKKIGIDRFIQSLKIDC